MAKFYQPKDIVSIDCALKIMASTDIRDFFGDQNKPHRFPFGLWFRGHSKIISDSIEPRAFRKSLPPSTSPRLGIDEEGCWDETNVYEHLRLRAPGHDVTYRSPFDWLCLMQHYSVPTRLLDWSESILSALYFAVKEERDHDGELVVLHAKRLNVRSKDQSVISTPDDAHVIIRAEMTTTRSRRRLEKRSAILVAIEEDARGKFDANWVENSRRPIAVFPRRLNDRMVFQSSVFTIHGGKVYGTELAEDYPPEDRIPDPITLEQVNDETPILLWYRIPHDRKGPILEELFHLGIHEASLFPELDHQADFLQRLWWYRGY